MCFVWQPDSAEAQLRRGATPWTCAITHKTSIVTCVMDLAFWNAGPSRYCGDPKKKIRFIKNNGKIHRARFLLAPPSLQHNFNFCRKPNVAKWHEKEPGACWCIPVLGPLREGSILRVGTRNGARSGESWLVDARVWGRRPEWAWPEGGHGFGR